MSLSLAEATSLKFYDPGLREMVSGTVLDDNTGI